MTADDKIEKAANGEEAAESEHPATEGTTEEEEAAINPCYYDKTKSFFDNLSCNDSRSVGSYSSVGQQLVSEQQKCVAEFELQKPDIAFLQNHLFYLPRFYFVLILLMKRSCHLTWLHS